MSKKIRIVYLVSTGLLSVLMMMSAGMYFFNHEMVVSVFESLSYPSYLIYPLAIAKILGLVAIWTNKSRTLKEWAYAGFIIDFSLAATAHLKVGDGEAGAAIVALVLVFTSYAMYQRQLKGEVK